MYVIVSAPFVMSAVVYADSVRPTAMLFLGLCDDANGGKTSSVWGVEAKSFSRLASWTMPRRSANTKT